MISRQSLPSGALSFYHQPGNIVYNKESFVHKSVVDGAPVYLNSNNSFQINILPAKENLTSEQGAKGKSQLSESRQIAMQASTSRPDVEYNSYMPQPYEDNFKGQSSIRT